MTLDSLEQADPIYHQIGSASPQPNKPLLISCALSIDNFKKLKRLGARLSKDPATRAIVARLREQLDEYEKESRLVLEAKNGGVCVYDEIYCEDYEFKVKPFSHQVVAFHFLHSTKTPAFFGGCGVGKTAAVLWFAHSLTKQGNWTFLVFCPVNLIEHVWIEDAAKFLADEFKVNSLRESSAPSIRVEDWPDGADRKDKEARKKAYTNAKRRHSKKLVERYTADADMFVINYENVRTDAKEKRITDLVKRRKNEGDNVCLILDESTRFKSRTSRTYKALKRIRAHCERCVIMTGTPSPNGLADLWSQFMVLDEGMTLGPSFTDYRHDTHYQFSFKVGPSKNKTVVKWNPKAGSPRIVHAMINPRMIRFHTDDCVDLPPRRFLVRHIDMTKDQRSLYDDMEEYLFTEIDGEPVTARVAVTKLMKLREITGGFVINDYEEQVAIDKVTPKMAELDLLLEQALSPGLIPEGPPTKALVWAQYQWECNTLIARYEKAYGARGLFGGISQGKRDAAIRAFKGDPKCRVLICHPKSAGHGLTLTEASYAIYYSLSYDLEEFEQSFRRNARPGQERKQTYYFLVCPGTIDEELLSAIQRKKNLADVVTDGAPRRTHFVQHRESTPGEIQLDWLSHQSDAISDIHGGEDSD